MATPSLGIQNFFSTTLSSTITASDTTIYLNSVPSPDEGYLVLDLDNSSKEIIYYTSKGANYVTCPSVAAGRGVGITSAVGHSSGASVRMTVVGEYWEALQDGTAFTGGSIGADAYASGWTTTAVPAPNTVTYNGNRSYSLVFNATDLTGYISPGMRLRTTRTVAAPNQCTSLNGTTQYYNKTSPAGMTFTDDFVVSAWIKLSSYNGAVQAIASRYNGTSGWSFAINASGQVVLTGVNGGAANTSGVQSYQSIPLNKWVHVAAQLDMSAFTATTTTSYIMIDGVDVPATVSRTGTNPTALIQAGNLEIGTQNAGSFFTGKIAQVAIFNAKVTQATMQGYISQGLAGTETNLISAYSFNNAITDLNTSNANNLSAQGSAVATNADSPFGGQASGSISTTLDYGIVTKTAFSTNTTLTVQVPEGCTIPTSGGVTSMAYSVHKAPYGITTDTSKWEIVHTYKTSATQASAVASTWYNIGGVQITLPLGAWDTQYSFSAHQGSGANGNFKITLSTANNTEADPEFTAWSDLTVGASSLVESLTHTRRKVITPSAQAAYYINVSTSSGNSPTINLLNANNTGVLRSSLAYI